VVNRRIPPKRLRWLVFPRSPMQLVVSLGITGILAGIAGAAYAVIASGATP
jgi:hypothetical protein